MFSFCCLNAGTNNKTVVHDPLVRVTSVVQPTKITFYSALERDWYQWRAERLTLKLIFSFISILTLHGEPAMFDWST